MGIKDIMSDRVVTVEMDDTLLTVKNIFDNTRFHHLLVVGDNKLLGVVSDRDLLRALSPYIDSPSELNRDTATLQKRVHQIMTRQPTTLLPNASIYDAIKIFNSNDFSCIPVVNDSNDIIGIVTWRDILMYVEEKMINKQALNQVCRRKDDQ